MKTEKARHVLTLSEWSHSRETFSGNGQIIASAYKPVLYSTGLNSGSDFTFTIQWSIK